MGLDRHRIDAGLARLFDFQLVDFRPWKPDGADGEWQLLPVPARQRTVRHECTMSARQVLQALGFTPPENAAK